MDRISSGRTRTPGYRWALALATSSLLVATTACASRAPAARRASPSVQSPTAAPDAPRAAGSPEAAASAAPCRDSTSPACGAFRWDPKVDDQPLLLTASASNESPRVGERVVFTVGASDADAVPSLGTFDTGPKGPGIVADNFPSDGCSRAFGPWTPPHPQSGSFERTFEKSYDAAGTYEVFFTAFSEVDDDSWQGRRPGDEHGLCMFSPYSSSARAALTIVVRS